MASNDGNSSWWGNLIKSAKEKSINALEIMKTDLAEFTSTMTTDLNQASSSIIDPKTTQSFISSTLSYITGENDNLSGKASVTTKVSSTDASDTSSSTINIKLSLQDRYKEELTGLQTNETTYLTDPKPETADEFSEWFGTFDPDNYKPEISNLLIEQADMRLIYSQLVPAKVSNAQFWGRYFFKVNQLEEDHKKRAKLIERADEVISHEKETTDWDEDLDEENKTIEKEEEEQEPKEIENQENQDTEVTSPKEETSQEENDLKINEPAVPTESTTSVESIVDKMVSSPSDSQIVDGDSIEIKSNSSSSSTSTMSNKAKTFQMVDKLEMSQKTEDSDDWEKVSEASDKNKLSVSGDGDEETTAKSETENDNDDQDADEQETGTNENEEVDEDEEESASETDLNQTPTSKPRQKEESDEKKSAPSKSKNRNDDDWDDWE